MTTREIIEAYYKGLNQKHGWEDMIAEDMNFIGLKTKTIGKTDYVDTTRSFLALVRFVRLTNLIIEGDQACAVVNYDLLSPSGKTAESSVAEILTVNKGRINSSAIFFDTAAFREFMARG
jgi:ketosteroid isomerase-like protein